MYGSSPYGDLELLKNNQHSPNESLEEVSEDYTPVESNLSRSSSVKQLEALQKQLELKE